MVKDEVLFVAKQNRNLVLFYVVGCLVFAAIGVTFHEV